MGDVGRKKEKKINLELKTDPTARIWSKGSNIRCGQLGEKQLRN